MPKEQLISLGQAAAFLESEYGLKRSRRNVWSWAYYGLNGAKLEATRVGTRWLTSREALRRFLSNSYRANHPGGERAELRVG